MEVEACAEREGEKEREEKENSFPKSIKKWIKNQAKINQKSTKKKPKIHQKINQKLIKNQSWRGPGGSLEAIGGQYRKLWMGMGFLRPSWGHLGGLLGRLGDLLGASWARLGGRNRTPSRPNIDPKIDQNFDAFGDQLFKEFSLIFLPKMKPWCLQKPLGIDVNLENLFFQKTLFFLWKQRFLWFWKPNLGLHRGAKTREDRPRQTKTRQDKTGF